MVPQSLKVLLVEDDPGDVDLTKEALKDSKLAINLVVAEDGEKAIEYLTQEVEKPSLILLDLNLPKKDGRQVLEEIKRDEDLMKIPVVVLTTSDQDADICRSYGLGANAYVTKPVGFDQFQQVVRQIQEFWFTVVKLPSKVK